MIEPSKTPGELHIAGGFSLDAIVYADGRYETDRLGGNALWAAMGARATGLLPRVHAVVGADYPDAALQRLRSLGFDISSVRRTSAPTGVRVTFSYGADGSRRQPASDESLAMVPGPARARFIDTTRQHEVMLSSQPDATDLAEDATTAASSWHLGLLPAARYRELVDRLAGHCGYLQADCPARFELRRDGLGVLHDTLHLLDVFLPSTSDTDVFLPELGRAELVPLFHRLGARTVVLKCGEHGAVVSERGRGSWQVPVFPGVDAIDATGAGDVFAGAFAAELSMTGSLVRAACAGAAAASFAAAVQSPLDLDPMDRTELGRRMKQIERGVTRR